MLHLTREELARLLDERATPEQARHLAACEECGDELGALRELALAAGALADLAPPAALRERVLASAALRNEPAEERGGVNRGLRFAAAVVLFLAGAAGGALIGGTPAAGPSEGARGGAPGAAAPRTVAEAAAALQRAEAAYLEALSVYSELSEDRIGMDPVNRLAALEGIVLTTRSALREAPADPVINTYHLTALGHRDALLRQLMPDADAADGDGWY